MLDWEQFYRGDAELLQIFDRAGAAESGVSAAQFRRHIGAEPGETLHVHFVDDGTVERNAGPFVIAPIERVIDHRGFRHPPRVVAEIAGEILLRPADDVAEHFVRPIHLPRDRFRVRIDQQLRAVETHSVLRIVRAVNAIAIKLSRPHIRKKDVPDLVGLFRYRDPDIFLRRIDVIEEAKIDRGRVLGKNREVDSVAEPGRSERIRIAEPNFYRRHKTERVLSATGRRLATAGEFSTGTGRTSRREKRRRDNRSPSAAVLPRDAAAPSASRSVPGGT